MRPAIDTSAYGIHASSSASERPAPSAARHPHDTDAADVVKVVRADGTLDPTTDPRLSPAEIVRLYTAMVRLRLLDERLTTLQRQGRIGFHLGSLGEEAAILGAAFAMREKDWIFPGYREVGAALLRGLPLQRYLDGMFGNARDPAKGRQMPDHPTFRAGHVAAVSGAVGTQITQAVGFAWAARTKREEIAVLACFGDGATSSNDFHNGLNFAGVFKAPVVFFCRNNGWALSAPTERQTGSATFAEKGVAYGVPSARVDGNDVLAVVQVTRDAVARAARGEGPTLIEALTYRMGPHSTSDDLHAYPTDESLEAWKPLDPIARLRRHLERTEAWSEARDKAIDAELEVELEAAIDAADKAPPPTIDSMFDDVYASPPWHLVEQREALKRGPRPKGQ
ncbi:MAG: thiamine pyrophosphate-dependent dehydrogenase E1 component subunit alpha [Byssovorax sp.]